MFFLIKSTHLWVRFFFANMLLNIKDTALLWRLKLVFSFIWDSLFIFCSFKVEKHRNVYEKISYWFNTADIDISRSSCSVRCNITYIGRSRRYRIVCRRSVEKWRVSCWKRCRNLIASKYFFMSFLSVKTFNNLFWGSVFI